jgi:hypothetical protein
MNLPMSLVLFQWLGRRTGALWPTIGIADSAQ